MVDNKYTKTEKKKNWKTPANQQMHIGFLYLIQLVAVEQKPSKANATYSPVIYHSHFLFLLRFVIILATATAARMKLEIFISNCKF